MRPVLIKSVGGPMAQPGAPGMTVVAELARLWSPCLPA